MRDSSQDLSAEERRRSTFCNTYYQYSNDTSVYQDVPEEEEQEDQACEEGISLYDYVV